MIDPKVLLEQFLGKNAGGDVLQKGKEMAASKGGTLAIGAAAGGLLTVLLGSKNVRKLGGAALGYGGAAVLGGLAYKAWQEYQRRSGAPASAPPSGEPPRMLPAPAEKAFDLSSNTAADGSDFRLAILRAMIAAAKADGHVDAAEQERIFARVEEAGMSAEEKGFVFDELRKPLDLDAIAALAANEAQASEVWLASRLAVDPDDIREKAYLDALGARLKLPADLIRQLEEQIRSAVTA